MAPSRRDRGTGLALQLFLLAAFGHAVSFLAGGTWCSIASAFTPPSLAASLGTRRETSAPPGSLGQNVAGSLGRRELAVLSGTLAGTALQPGQPPRANAEEVGTKATAKIQRVVVNVGDEGRLERELRFWQEAVQMKVQQDSIGPDGQRSVVVAFSPEASSEAGSFGVEIKVDPPDLKRKLPTFLNYNQMQATVNALNFIQVSSKGTTKEIFTRVQSSGGESLFGDKSYLDVESPRGVAVRMVPRETLSVDLVSFNVEVPTFDSVVKFYERAMGLKELRYLDTDPPVGKLSVQLISPLGGAKLLLTPVADGRMKERDLDEFEGVIMSSPDAEAVANAGSAAIALAIQEEEEKRKELERRLIAARAQKESKTVQNIKEQLKARSATPVVEYTNKAARVDDGVGDQIIIVDAADFDRALAV